MKVTGAPAALATALDALVKIWSSDMLAPLADGS